MILDNTSWNKLSSTPCTNHFTVMLNIILTWAKHIINNVRNINDCNHKPVRKALLARFWALCIREWNIIKDVRGITRHRQLRTCGASLTTVLTTLVYTYETCYAEFKIVTKSSALRRSARNTRLARLIFRLTYAALLSQYFSWG